MGYGGYGLASWFTFGLIPLFILSIIWVVFWKAVALWHAVKRGERVWFILLLIVNTFGFLEIFYLFAVAKMKFSDLGHIDQLLK